MQPASHRDEYLRAEILEITSRVAAGFISAETAADQIMKLSEARSR